MEVTAKGVVLDSLIAPVNGIVRLTVSSKKYLHSLLSRLKLFKSQVSHITLNFKKSGALLFLV